MIAKKLGKQNALCRTCEVDYGVIPSSSSTLRTYSRVSSESTPTSRIKVREFVFFNTKICLLKK